MAPGRGGERASATNAQAHPPAPDAQAHPPATNGEAHPAGERLLIALDVDGTLVDHELQLTSRVRAAVQAVVAAGHHVVIATGRSLTATRPVLDELGLHSGYLVGSNGAVTERMDPSLPGGSQVVDVVTFDPAAAIALLREALPGAAVAVEVPDGSILVAGAFPEGELTGSLRVVDFDALDGVLATRVVVRSPQHTSAQFLDLTHRLGLKGVNYAVGWTAWLDLAPEGVSKASALENVRRLLGVPSSATLAAGDGRNDLEMLAWAHRSVAMGQSPVEVLAAATEVAKSVTDDGLAEVLEKLLAEEG